MGRKARTSRRNRVMGGSAGEHPGWQHDHFLECTRLHENVDDRDDCIEQFTHASPVPDLQTRLRGPVRRLRTKATVAQLA